MLTLKVDRTKLKTVTNYAKEKKVERQTVYNWIKQGLVTKVEIDGVIFVQQ
jgi:hypothetical protein